MPGWVRGVCGVVVFLLAAEAFGRADVINRAVLPLASTVLARAAGLAVSGRFLADVAATIGAWALGLAIAVAVAVPAGVVLGSLPGVRAATRAMVEFLRPIPSVALIVLVGLILGPGLRMNVTLIVYAAIWPVLFNTIYGLDDVDPVARETLRAFGFGRVRRDHPGGPAQRLAVHRHRDPAGVLHRDHPQHQHRVPHRPDQRQRDRRVHRRGEHRRREHLARARGRAVGRAAGPGRERGPGVGRAPGSALAPLVRAGAGVSRASGRVVARWAVIAAAVVLWQVWARQQGSSFFPPPSAIAARMYQQWFSGPASHLFLTPDAVGNVLPSLGRIAAGLAIAVVAGGVAGVAIGRSVALSGYLDPLLQFARALPAVTLVPVFIALFRLGTEMEVATIAFGTVWPILLNTIDGARSVDPVQMETARAFRLPGWQRLTRLIIPATMPRFFAGLRLSVSLALVLMVFAELAGSSNGLGYEMNNAESSFDMTWVWATIVLLALLGNVFNLLEQAVEHRMLGWHRGARGRTS